MFGRETYTVELLENHYLGELVAAADPGREGVCGDVNESPLVYGLDRTARP